MKRVFIGIAAFTISIAAPALSLAATGLDLSGALANPISNLGNFEFFVAIPEPGTFTLLSLAGAGLLLRRRRQG